MISNNKNMPNSGMINTKSVQGNTTSSIGSANSSMQKAKQSNQQVGTSGVGNMSI